MSRSLRVFAVAGIAAAVMMSGMALSRSWSQAKAQKLVAAKELRLVNDEGQVIAALASDEEGAGELMLFDREGKVQAGLSAGG